MIDHIEGIRLAQRIASAYKEMKSTEEEIENLQKENKRDESSIDTSRHEFVEYFKPFLIFAMIVGLIVLFFAYLENFMLHYNGDPGADFFGKIWFLLPLAWVLLITLPAGIYSNRRKNKVNARMDEDENYRRKKISEREAGISKLNDRLKELRAEVDECNEILESVPDYPED